MISVSDILKILDNAPVWKTLKALPGQVKALEERVAALEKRLDAPGLARGGARDVALTCALCQGGMRVVAERADPTFGRFGIKTHHVVCDDCGHETDLRFDPAKGYGRE